MVKNSTTHKVVVNCEPKVDTIMIKRKRFKKIKANALSPKSLVKAITGYTMCISCTKYYTANCKPTFAPTDKVAFCPRYHMNKDFRQKLKVSRWTYNPVWDLCTKCAKFKECPTRGRPSDTACLLFMENEICRRVKES